MPNFADLYAPRGGRSGYARVGGSSARASQSYAGDGPSFAFEDDLPPRRRPSRRTHNGESCARCSRVAMSLAACICCGATVLLVLVGFAAIEDQPPATKQHRESTEHDQAAPMPSVRDFMTSSPILQGAASSRHPSSAGSRETNAAPPVPPPKPLPPANSPAWPSSSPPPPPQPLMPPDPPPPQPFPPLLAKDAQANLDRLNAQFVRGHASNNLLDVGILVHQLDTLDEAHPGENPTPWLQQHECPESGCADHLSGSIINRKVPYIYSDDAVGFVMSPEQAVVRCAFPEDGGTMSRTCQPGEAVPADCLPGCYSDGRQCVTHTVAATKQNCYTPQSLANMLYQCEMYSSRHFDNNNGCRQGNGCRYNEIILERVPWTERQPHATEAIFYPAGGDAASARRVHAAFLRHYSLTAAQVPLVRLNLAHPQAPFEAPAATDGYTTQPVCAALFRPESKMWRMWGVKKTWVRSNHGEKRCWHYYKGGVDAFFDVERVLAGEGCGLNWLEGVEGDMGEPEARPHFARPAPALLGFDEALYDYCSSLLHLQKGKGDFNTELAQRCVKANQNVLRLLSRRPGAGWTMCSNMRWLMCAALGKLPGQEQPAQMHFATPPRELTLAEWTAPTTYPCDDGQSCSHRYTVGDVFYSEACTLLRICRNGADVFKLEKGVRFRCDLDRDGYADYVRDLLRTTVNIDTQVEGYYA